LSRDGGNGDGRSPLPRLSPVYSAGKKYQAERKKSLAVRRGWQGVISVKQECRP